MPSHMPPQPPPSSSALHTWGRAKNFRLGRDLGSRDAHAPAPVPAVAGAGIRSASCGGGHTAVVTASGALLVFGYSQYGQLGLGDRSDVCAPTVVEVGEGVTGVACGRYHTMAVGRGGGVYTWGGGKNGRLGHGDEKIRLVPKRVGGISGAVGVAAGYHNNLVLTAAGDVWSWGWGAHGQLGTGDVEDRNAPVIIEELSGLRVVRLACGDRHSFAVTADGRVYAWGSNEFGQLGVAPRGETVLSPVCVSGLEGLVVVGLSSGDRHSAAVTNVGSVYTWGCGSDGQCGHGDFGDVGRPRVVEGMGGENVASVHCGHNFTLAVTDCGGVWAWGNNTYGQLGNGGEEKSAVPVKVAIPGGTRAGLVACAHFHCVLVTKCDDDAKKEVGKVDVDEAVDDITSAEKRLVAVLAKYEKRAAEMATSAKSQSRDLIIADILRLSTSPLGNSNSAASSFSGSGSD